MLTHTTKRSPARASVFLPNDALQKMVKENMFPWRDKLQKLYDFTFEN
jgi:hypothetical protein